MIHQNKIKLADFGLSCRAGVSNYVKNIFGKIPYVDPQRFKNQTNNNDKKSDVYSVGVLLWEVSSGQQPFESYNSPHDETALTLHILDGKRETPILDTPTDYINIYTSMNIFIISLLIIDTYLLFYLIKTIFQNVGKIIQTIDQICNKYFLNSLI